MTAHHVSDQDRQDAQQNGAAGDLPSGSLPIEEIYDSYPDEWVATKVTGWDNGEISHAVVLAHGPTEGSVTEAAIHAHEVDPKACTYIFLGGHRATSSEEWHEQLMKAIELGPKNAFWRW